LKRLAVITTHPIQYNAPLFQLLASRKVIELKVFYTWGDTVQKDKYDPGFERVVDWDIPLLENYPYVFVDNIAKKKGSHHFSGIDNPGLINAVRDWKADCILVYGWNFKSHLSALRYFKGKIPILFRGDSTLLDKPGLIKKSARRIALAWVYRNVDEVLYTGRENLRYFQMAGLKDAQLIYAPHSIDNKRFAKAESDAVDFREQWGIGDKAFVFLFAGKLESKKNPLLLLEAFLSTDLRGSVLLIVGDGPLRNEISQAAAGHKNVLIKSFVNQSQMPALYKAANCFVLPSRGPGETWGLAINEAIASGIPVIGSDKCGATADLIVDDETGFRFNADSIASLQVAMCNIKNRHDLKRDWKPALEKKINGFDLPQLACIIEERVMALNQPK
jgi:glycosyltransferase involved in cell wall biosynthesis